MKKFGRTFRKNKISGILVGLITILSIAATGYLLYSLSLLNGIEDKIRFLISIDLIVILLGYLIALYKNYHKYNKCFKFLLIIGIIIFSGFGITGHYVLKTYRIVDNMTIETTTYSASLISLKSNKATDLKSLSKDGKIGIVSDRENVIGYQLPQQMIKENNIGNEMVEYDTYLEILHDLKDKKIEYAFLPSNYVASYQNMEELAWDKIGEETKILGTLDKTEKNTDTTKVSKIDKPFTALIMGVDSDKENLANTAFNGDALMLVTFNPDTLNTTMLSIPRDSYVPIACFKNQLKNKITHAAAYGETCMINTIQNFTGIDIDYYVKINFTGVVNIIDALGGIEVDVPYSFCEQNSKRQFGSHMIYVEKGKQTLNGEEALALARNRKTHSNICAAKWTSGTRNDFVRGQNQQLVLRGILNKLKDVKSLNTIMNILDKVSSSMATNMSTNEILSLYSVGKDVIVKSQQDKVEDLLGIQKLYLSGSDARIYDPRSGFNLYNYVLNENSVSAVVSAMKVNLGLEKPKMKKTFAFDLDTKHEETIIGKNVKNTGSSISKLPSFIGMSESTARAKAGQLGIGVTIVYSETGTGTNGTVIKQDKAAGYDVSYVKTITLTVLKKEESVKNPTTPTPPSSKPETNPSEPSNGQKPTTPTPPEDNDQNKPDDSGKDENDKENEPTIPGTPTDTTKKE